MCPHVLTSTGVCRVRHPPKKAVPSGAGDARGRQGEGRRREGLHRQIRTAASLAPVSPHLSDSVVVLLLRFLLLECAVDVHRALRLGAPLQRGYGRPGARSRPGRRGRSARREWFVYRPFSWYRDQVVINPLLTFFLASDDQQQLAEVLLLDGEEGGRRGAPIYFF